MRPQKDIFTPFVNNMKALSLFSGIGGIDLAAEWAGIETVAFCEYADFPRKILKKHWPDTPIFKDVKELNKKMLESEGIDIGTIDIIHGGFPCQPYSTAGKRMGKKDDRDLWPEMFRIIREIQPRWVVGENVANFVNMELERTLVDLESEGYETQTFIIPATGVDAKQQRNRTFIVAYSDSMWESQPQRSIEDLWRWFGYSSEIMANTESVNKRRLSFRAKKKKSGLKRSCQYVANADGKRCRQMEHYDCRRDKSRWKPEPRVGRVAHGVPNRVDRLKSLGNAVVPQQIFPIFQAIIEIEQMTLL